jgi:two-component system cell cycle sensor histidine kinase/response regulator CckA
MAPRLLPNSALNMDRPLRILHLEDDPDFTALVAALLEQEQLHIEIVHAKDYEDFVAALETGNFDLILADFLLPSCNGLQALEVAQIKRPDTPFLLVSGTINEYAAIESLRNGATDYVLKSKLERLFPAVTRAVKESRERKQRQHAETELTRREKYFRALTENSLDILTILDSNGCFQYNSPSIYTVLGYDPRELFGKNALSFVHPDDLTDAQQVFERTMQNPQLRFTHVFRYLHADGSWRHLESVRQNRLDDPDISGVVVHSRDVTERKLAAEALARSEASLAAAQRIARLGSWDLELNDLGDVNRNPLFWSDETFRIFGFEPRQVPVTNDLFFELVHPDDRKLVSDAVAQALRHKEAYDIEHRIVLREGEERIVRERGEIMCDDNGNPVRIRGIVMDVTERKRLEEQLRQSQKMEAIGQLAGGVAHDFNNILTVIHGHASLMLHAKILSLPAEKSVQQIVQAAERAASLTRQLLTFSRRQVMQPKHLDLNQLVSNMTMMLGRILGEDIALQLHYCPEPAFLRGDAGMIEQILLNLAVNARDAMPKGGQLSIRISTLEIGASRAAWHPEARPGKFICLSVADTGCGISPEILRRIFEPFFTTKEVGKGTGLGLATVYGIVKQHQGWIEVKSELGKGAMFRVFLPATERQGISAENNFSTEPPPRGGSETILVVEDEAPLRELVCNVLSGHGYNVLQAESGAKALDVWRGNKDDVDLLLTDVIMPDRLNGRELAEELRGEDAELKVIFMSGYSADAVGKDFISQPGFQYLQKPYDPRKLAQAVRECLDAQ